MKSRIVIYLICLLSCLTIVPHPKVHAASQGVVLYQLQTGGAISGTASEEMVLVRNNSAAPLDISGWCIQYSSATNGVDFTNLACVPSQSTLKIMLDGNGGLTIFATDQYLLKNPVFNTDFKFSAGMAATGGHIRLLDASGTEIDRVGWGTAVHPEAAAAVPHSSGKVLSRSNAEDTDNNQNDFMSAVLLQPLVSGVYEVEIPKDVCPNIEGVQAIIPNSYMLDEAGNCKQDTCPNLDGLQATVPAGYTQLDSGGPCELIVFESRPLLITEILPNAPSYDDGLEFIEIYNPNDSAVELSGYVIDLGSLAKKSYTFTSGEIAPGQYITVSDTQSGIILPNTSGSVRLIAPAGNTVSEPAMYSAPPEGLSWSFLEDEWAFTNQVTSGEANKPSLVVDAEDDKPAEVISTVLAPCPAGKVRNPETNRCRLIPLAVEDPASCPEGQFRNPATNRCKSVAVESGSLTPCKEGQERNPETNRCRSVAAASKTLVPCEQNEERNPETNRCKKKSDSEIGSSLSSVKDVYVQQSRMSLNFVLVGALLTCAVAYVGYEWRHELLRKFSHLKARKEAFAK